MRQMCVISSFVIYLIILVIYIYIYIYITLPSWLLSDLSLPTSHRIFAIGRAVLWQSLLNYFNSTSENAVYIVPESVTNQNLTQMSAEICFQKEDLDKLQIKQLAKQLVKKSTKQTAKKMTKISCKRPAEQEVRPARKTKQGKKMERGL